MWEHPQTIPNTFECKIIVLNHHFKIKIKHKLCCNTSINRTQDQVFRMRKTIWSKRAWAHDHQLDWKEIPSITNAAENNLFSTFWPVDFEKAFISSIFLTTFQHSLSIHRFPCLANIRIDCINSLDVTTLRAFQNIIYDQWEWNTTLS